MKKCNYCNTKSNPDDAHFCMGCGKQIEPGQWMVYNFASKVVVDKSSLELLQKRKNELEQENVRLRSQLKAGSVKPLQLPKAYLIVRFGDSLSVVSVGSEGRFLFANKRSLGLAPATEAQVIRGMMNEAVRFVVEPRDSRLFVSNLATPMLVNGSGLSGSTVLRNEDTITFPAVAGLSIIVSTPQRNK